MIYQKGFTPMNIFKTLLIAVVAVIGFTSVASATTTVNVNVWPVRDVNGTAVATPTLWVLVADVDDDGFGGYDFDSNPLTDNTSDVNTGLLFDNGDMIVAKGETNDYFSNAGLPGEIKTEAQVITLTTVAATAAADTVDPGDGVYLFWFVGKTLSDLDMGEGTNFGVIYAGELANDGAALTVSQVDFSSDQRALYFTAASDIPEPASLALLSLSGLMMVRRRRK